MTRRQSRVDDFLKEYFGWLPARIALSIMAWFGFVNLYMVRINLSVAIVAMVKRNITGGDVVACSSQNSNNGTFLLTHSNGSAGNVYESSLPTSNLQDEEGEFLWDETTQGFILGAFFYGYALTQIIGGRMAELYGTRVVYGVCILGGAISAFLSPVMARWHYGALIALRTIQGMLQGVSWPSMHACIARWIPPIERPRYIAIVYLASTLSSSITMPLCGILIDNYGWALQFYVMGSLSLLWCCFWFCFMYNSPDEHPRISQEELHYIKLSLKESGSEDGPPIRIPWREMAKSVPVWAIFAICTGNGWGIALLLAQLPTYMKNVLGFSIKSNGLLSASPFISRYIGGIVWSSLSAWLITRKYLSVRMTRRIFGAMALWGPGAMLLGVSFAGCDSTVAVTLLCLGLFFNGANTTSGFVNHTDIAPNYAGTLFGVDNTWASLLAFVVPVVTGIMTDGQQTVEAWQRVFWICVPIYFLTSIFYLIFVSTDVQPWNDINHSESSSVENCKVSDSNDEGTKAAL